MKITVHNKRPVQVTCDGHRFRPRSRTSMEADARLIRHLESRYGLVVEPAETEPGPADVVLGFDGSLDDDHTVAIVHEPECNEGCADGSHQLLGDLEVATIEAPAPEPDLTCPDCGRVCGSAFGLQSHQRSHRKES